MSGSSVVVRPLVEGDLDRADRVYRTAFGTFRGAPEPEQFFGDADVVHTRWRTYPTAAFAAEVDGELVGSNFASDWGSIGFFGPLTVRPDHWDQGIGRRLLEPTMDLFSRWQVRHLGLFTFAESTKHVGLYQSFGFWPRYLTAVMAAPVVAPSKAVPYRRYSELALHYPGDPRDAVRELTEAVYEGLDLGREIGAVRDQRLGETVLIDDATGLQGVGGLSYRCGKRGRQRPLPREVRGGTPRSHCGAFVCTAHRRLSGPRRSRACLPAFHRCQLRP